MAANDRLIYLIGTAQHILQSYLKRESIKAGVKITPPQAAILFLLKKNPCSMSELSNVLHVDNSAVTGLIDRLEKSGYVARKMNPLDRRSYSIHITDSGISEINRAKKVINRVNDEIKAGFSEQEITAFKEVLNSFFLKFNKE